MAETLRGVAELRAVLRDSAALRANSFEFLKQLVALASRYQRHPEVQDVVLRCLEQRDVLGRHAPLLDALVREFGLFPYLNATKLKGADRLAFELHRPLGLNDDVVLHSAQAKVFHELMSRQNVILSAPTSFGKSLLIDATIAAMEFNCSVLVVPTIALIDETRRRLVKRFGERYKIVTQNTQRRSRQTIFVMTQERVLDRSDLSNVDFFVIDEFYKLSPQDENDDRAFLLNQAFYKLLKTGAQFYLIGPSIVGVSPELARRVEFKFIYEPYNTVACDVHAVDLSEGEIPALRHLSKTLQDQTIVYCRTPDRAAEAARAILQVRPRTQQRSVLAAADWAEKNFHREWHVVRALRHGIGIHHARVPRALAQYAVRSFNAGHLHWLVCTSTLIEGVNTSAKNMVLFDNKVSNKNLDLFTFNNIKGRSGRMLRHFIGHVYLFAPPPDGELPVVDVPILTQPNDAPTSLLLQVDDDELSDESRQRLDAIINQSHLSVETIRQSAGVDPITQINIAREIRRSIKTLHPLLSWDDVPRRDQLTCLCDIIWRHFNGTRKAYNTFNSASELADFILNLRAVPATSTLIGLEVARGMTPDDAVRMTLDRLKLWVNFHFPKLAMVISRIQAEVFGAAGLSIGDYAKFALSVESYFLPPAAVGLEEFGIPLELVRKLAPQLQGYRSIDQVVSALRQMSFDRMNLHPFERELLDDALEHLQ